MAQRTGTLVTAPLRIQDDNIPYPIAYANEIQGGAQSGALLTDRDAVPVWNRQWGMSFRVYNDNTNNGNYVLVYGKASTTITDNTNWVLDATSSSESNNVKKIDQIILNNGSINLPANCKLDSILVNAMAELSAFGVGYTSGVDDLVMFQDVSAGDNEWQKSKYIRTPTTIYFSGVTIQSTCSVIIFQF